MATTTPPSTPTLDRRSAEAECNGSILTHSNKIGEFLDWLSEQGIHLSTYSERDERPVYRNDLHKSDPRRQLPEGMKRYTEEHDRWLNEIIEWEEIEVTPRLIPIGENFNSLLHRYFEIDPEAEEAERRALLDYVRSLNE